MKPTALVVDDSPVMRMRLTEILSRRCQGIHEASSVEEALMSYDQHRPDLVTMDISMRGENGMGGLWEILQRDPEASVVMVSALGQRKIVFDCLAMGAKDFIVKPFDTERVLASVDRILALRGSGA